MLRYGIKNAIALQGTNIPQTVIDLAKKKSATLFVDGDRGGELIIKKVAELTEMNFVAFAPDGKEVEELTQKEILKALRMKILWTEAKTKNTNVSTAVREIKPIEAETRRPFSRDDRSRDERPRRFERYDSRDSRGPSRYDRNDSRTQSYERHEYTNPAISENETVILDRGLNVLGKVPKDELADTLENMDGVYAVALGSESDNEIKKIAYEKRIKVIAKHIVLPKTESAAKARS